MEIADAQKFLQENHRACIAVRQRDGWPQMTFVTPGIDSEGRVIITSRGTTYKIKHLRRDPRVSMLIFGEQYSGSKFVQIHGTAEIHRAARGNGHFDLLVQADPRRAQELG